MTPSASEIIAHLTKDIPESSIEPVTKAEELAELLEKTAEQPDEPNITPDMEEMAKIAIAQEIINGKIDIYNKWNEAFSNIDALPFEVSEEEKTAAMAAPIEGIDPLMSATIESQKLSSEIVNSLTDNDGHLGIHIRKVFGY